MKRAALAVAALLTLQTVRAQEGLVLVERTAYLMGTRAQLATWARDRERGLQALEAALGVLETSERELSTWRADSDITALNAAPQRGPRRLADRLCDDFRVLAHWQRETNSAFDPAIGRMIDAWDIHGDGRVPAPGELLRARANSGFDLLGFDSARCTISRRADVAVDVGAWGKGEALDRAARALDAGPWMIDLGGQILVRGNPPGEKGWGVAIADPLHRNRPHLEFHLRDGSLSTSAGSERDLTVHGTRVGHILDPRTGRPAPFSGSVTVWHRQALVADILSTALFVMGPAEGLRWAETRGLSACYLVPHSGGRIEPIMTAAFRTGVVFSGARGPRD